MRAVMVRQRGESGTIADIPAPKPHDGELLIRVNAAGVNPIDWKIVQREEKPLPAIVGQDFAGVVVACGDGVSRFKTNDRVFGIAREHGSYCEFTVVPEHDAKQPVAEMPDGLGPLDAAALPTAGLTALAALDQLEVKAGTTLLILGVSGGVGSFAAQIALRRGARVIGTARSNNAEYVANLGAVELIPYDREDPVDGVRALCPEGVDAVLDLVDDREHSISIADAIKSGGSIVSTIGALDEAWFAQQNIDAKNLVMDETPASSPEGLSKLARLVGSGLLRTMVAAEPALEHAPAVLEASKSGTMNGKTVLVVGI